MTAETQQEVLKHLYRLIEDTGSKSYEEVIRSVRVAMRNRVFAGVVRNLAGMTMPGAEQPEKFDEYLSRIETEEKFKSLLRGLDEPKPVERRLIMVALKRGIPLLRAFLIRTGKKLPPARGGPREKLSDPVKVSAIVDEIWDSLKEGETLRSVQERIGRRERVSLKTVQRRYREEMKRRTANRDHP